MSVVQEVLQGPTHLTFNHFNPKWQIWPKKCHQILTKQQKNVASTVQFNISDSSFLLEDIFNLTCTHSTGPSLTSVGRWTGSRLRVRTAWSLRVRTRLWAPRASKCSASTGPVWKHISSRCWVKKKQKNCNLWFISPAGLLTLPSAPGKFTLYYMEKSIIFMRTDWSRDKQTNVWVGKKPLSVVTARWISAENCEIQRTTKNTHETNVEMSAGPSCPVNMAVYVVCANSLSVFTFIVK